MGGLMGGGKPDTSAADESLRLQREQTAKATQQAEEEKRKYAEQMSGKRRALSRGGTRALLADNRLNPETGLTDTEKTLGA
tara:strand:+ start:121 stop:363 length:243 start_codon:yes stop_codon:yes gene_type:complete